MIQKKMKDKSNYYPSNQIPMNNHDNFVRVITAVREREKIQQPLRILHLWHDIY